MTYTGRQYQISEDTAPPKETNPAVVELDDGTDVQVIRIDTGTSDTPTPASASDPLPVSVQSTALPTGAATSANQALELAELQALNSLIPATYDYIALSYTGDNLTGVVFKSGGSGGSTVSTLTLAYTGAVLDSVTKT